ncbi:MAG: helix-turn-helix transcriptional regulator [Flavisolibacter sp.]|nr:helix-turn-helix transcriptional regulator [Flavisolibacter sp.]
MTEEQIRSVYVELGARIKQARENMGFTQDILADQLSLTRASIVNIESGRQRPMLHTIIKISDVLNTSLKELLPDSHTEEADPLPLVAVSSGTDIGNIVSDEIEVNDETKDAILQFFSHSKSKS